MTCPATNQRASVDKKFLLTPFKFWLTNKSYSASTIRNYLSDIDNFLDFSHDIDLFSPETVSTYLKTISSDTNYSRYLSSLSKFFQFSLDQNLCKINPLKTALKDKKPSLNEVINQYSEHLNKKQFSPATTKNYLNDIKQFIQWSNSNQKSSTFPEVNLDKNRNLPKSTSTTKRGFSFKNLFKNSKASDLES